MVLQFEDSVAARGCAIATAALLGMTIVGCSAKKPTELVPGVITQLQVPRDLDGVEVEVQVNYTRTFCTPQPVVNGAVDLPRTLGVVSGTAPDTPVTIIVRGFSDSQTNPSTSWGCMTPLSAGVPNGPRVVRSSTQTYVDQHTLFLPMALRYSCFDSDCSKLGKDFTCEGAQCVEQPAPEVVASRLVDFDPSLIDGTGECFSPKACFPSGPSTLAVEPVDPDRCIYEVPAGAGINVRVFYQDVAWIPGPGAGEIEEQITNASESEILDEDPNEGFCLGTCPASAVAPDDAGSAAAPDDAGSAVAPDTGSAVAPDDAGSAVAPDAGSNTFQLAPGLCDLVKAAHAPPPSVSLTAAPAHTIGQVEVGLGCLSSKSPLLPICASERDNGSSLDGATLGDGQTGSFDGEACNARVVLTATPSAIYLVMDDSIAMKGAFGPTGYATVMSLSLADPVFDRTFTAFRFFSHDPDDGGAFDQSECTSATTPFAQPTVPFGVATDVQAQIASQVANSTAPEAADAGAASYAPLDLQAAMRPGVGAYAAVSQFLQNREVPNIAAVMFFLNRTPTGAGDAGAGNDCDPPLAGGTVKASIEREIQLAYEGSPSIRTYFVVLGNRDGADGTLDPGPLAFYSSLQADLPQMVTTIDATLPSTQAQQVLKNFSQAAEPLGTCLYEPVAGVGQVDYGDPSHPGSPIAIAPNAACNAAGQDTVDGWSIDDGRVRVCGQPCTDLQNTVLAASAAARYNQMPVPDVSVTGTIRCDTIAPVNDGAVPSTDAAFDATTTVDDGSSNAGAIDAGSDAGADDASSDAGGVDGD
jgi:hypothetical protein